MATKKIIASVTIHKPGAGHIPFTYDDQGVRKGSYKIVAIPPNTPVEIDAEDADDLIKRGLAVEAPKAGKAAEPPAA